MRSKFFFASKFSKLSCSRKLDIDSFSDANSYIVEDIYLFLMKTLKYMNKALYGCQTRTNPKGGIHESCLTLKQGV